MLLNGGSLTVRLSLQDYEIALDGLYDLRYLIIRISYFLYNGLLEEKFSYFVKNFKSTAIVLPFSRQKY